MFTVECLDHVALVVRDLGRSVEWYTRLLGLKRCREGAWDIPVMLCAGATGVALFPAGAAGASPPPRRPGDAGMSHLAFRVSRAGLEAARDVFRRLEVEFSSEDHTVARSLYVRDPDGNKVELTTYEV
jgi:catechol 2,3-dioxygenase-like lactoylglutathione lyase family enzyme